MKIKNRKKFTISITILGLIILFIILLSKQTYSKVEVKTKTIYASNGDTLWAIALEEQENNIYYSDKKLKDIIEDIKFVNSLKDSYIYQGQKLEIPTI